ncbi:MAG: rod shape-determining protein MreC [Salibacteraceae bacterium]
MRKLIQVILTHYVFGLFLLLELIGFLLLVRYNTFHQITYLSWLNEVTGGLNQKVANITQHFNLVEDNAVLAKENAMLRQKLRASYLDAENSFNPWVDTVYHQNFNFREAQVINNELSKQDNYLMINKGSLAGIQIGMGVINATGIVGIVTDVSSHYAVVMSVLNSRFQVGVRLKNQEYFGLLTWNGKDLNKAVLNNIQQFVQVQKSDSVETLGASGIFPEGIPVGQVDSVQAIDESNTWGISVALSANIQQAKHVYVVENIFKEEISNLEEGVE